MGALSYLHSPATGCGHLRNRGPVARLNPDAPRPLGRSCRIYGASMSLTYPLRVADLPVYTGTFDDADDLAADAILRASTHGTVMLKAGDLAELISPDMASVIDLRLLAPQITVEVSPA